MDELAAVYPNAVPMDIPMYCSLANANSLKTDRLNAFRTDLETRFKKSIEELKEELYFSAIFIMQGVVYSDLTIQLFSDILASKNGHILGDRRKQGDPQVVDLYSTNPDLVWPYQWPVPRYGPLTFIIALQSIFKAYYGFDIEYIQYGKPNEPTYSFCERSLQRLAAAQGIEISRFYMIGDNPASDIDGANRRGDSWVSILVRTGVFQGGDNSDKHPAKYVVEDMQSAVKLIFELENLDFKI